MDDDQNKKTVDSQEETQTLPPTDGKKQDHPEKSEKSDDQKISEPKDSEKSDKSEDQKVGEPENPKTETPDASDKSDTSDKSEPSDSSGVFESSDSSDVSDSSDPSEQPISTPAPKPQKDVPGARWYVVHTYSGHEAKVAATLKQRVESQQLQDKVLDILVPTQEKIEIKEGKKNKVKEKIFPGYLLIRMVLDDNSWLVVRTTPGITSFVGMGNKPTPLPDEEVNTIQRFMTMEAPKFKTSFSAGEAVKIVDGPFSEFLGSISEIDEERGKIKVLVSIFGRETPVELDFLQVTKI